MAAGIVVLLSFFLLTFLAAGRDGSRSDAGYFLAAAAWPLAVLKLGGLRALLPPPGDAIAHGLNVGTSRASGPEGPYSTTS